MNDPFRDPTESLYGEIRRLTEENEGLKRRLLQVGAPRRRDIKLLIAASAAMGFCSLCCLLQIIHANWSLLLITLSTNIPNLITTIRTARQILRLSK